mmetsp:Transcript_3570/g.10859  ORF Transcript_3570/g.10859 Transcript_3570/m.10859 type:complete len:256 (+) Transcript_3570:823-1590(+)
MLIQHTRHHPLVKLIAHTALRQDPLQSTPLHHVRVLKVCQLMRQHWPVLVQQVLAVGRCEDVSQAVLASGERLHLRNVGVGLAVQVLVVLSFPHVLGNGLHPPSLLELWLLSLELNLWLGVPGIQLEVVSPLPSPPEDFKAAVGSKLVSFFVVERLECLRIKRWMDLRLDRSLTMQHVAEGHAGLTRDFLEHPLQLLAGQVFRVSLRQLRHLGSPLAVAGHVASVHPCSHSLPQLRLPHGLLENTAAQIALWSST